MRDILIMVRDREHYHENSCVEAGGMGVEKSEAYHERLARLYRECADALEAALKIDETAPSASNNTTKGKICPQSAMVRVTGKIICMEDGEDCIGIEGTCKNGL